MIIEKDLKDLRPKERKYHLGDGDGLFLCVHPKGDRVWLFRYRFNTKRRQINLGNYPHMSIRDARRKRDDLADQIEQGIDPLDKKALGMKACNFFGEVATEYLQLKIRSGKASATIEKFRWCIFDHCQQILNTPISDVKAADILAIIKAIAAKGKVHTAHRVRGNIGEVMRYGVATLRCDHDPTPALRGALEAEQPQHRAAILNEADFSDLLNRIDGYHGRGAIRESLQLMALLFPRPFELRMAHRSEFDLENAMWEIPAERMKMRRPHLIPLARQAIDVIRRVDALAIPGPHLLSTMRDGRPVSENGMNIALRRMGIGKDAHCSHGFRSTASTLLNASGEDERVVEMSLGHMVGNSVSRVYNRHRYIEERRCMMQRWADRLDKLRSSSSIDHESDAAL